MRVALNETCSVTVDPGIPDVDSGIDVLPGERYSFSASGMWQDGSRRERLECRAVIQCGTHPEPAAAPQLFSARSQPRLPEEYARRHRHETRELERACRRQRE